MSHIHAMAESNYLSELDLKITTNPPHLALTGDLWGVFVMILEKSDRNEYSVDGGVINVSEWLT